MINIIEKVSEVRTGNSQMQVNKELSNNKYVTKRKSKPPKITPKHWEKKTKKQKIKKQKKNFQRTQLIGYCKLKN